MRIVPALVVILGILTGFISFVYWTFVDPRFWGANLVFVQIVSAIVGVSCALFGCLFFFFLLRSRRTSRAFKSSNSSW